LNSRGAVSPLILAIPSNTPVMIPGRALTVDDDDGDLSNSASERGRRLTASRPETRRIMFSVVRTTNRQDDQREGHRARPAGGNARLANTMRP